MEEEHTQAVIYVRVSDVKQKTQGNGLRSQEARLREYARYKRYNVIAVFEDDISGGSNIRKGFNNMLEFLRGSRKKGFTVLVEDFSRFARDFIYHFELKSELKKNRLSACYAEF